MSLSLYRKKRNFAATPEPTDKESRATGKGIFVVQRHKASHLHYDFRLEMDGTLKSWAVPKGPSMNPKDKRLAMRVEDHPVSYATFKGTIPEGNYGAGIVEIWDHGTFTITPGTDPGKKALAKGSLKVQLKGRKLKGGFALIKMKQASGNSWLLIKEKDDKAINEKYDSETLTPVNSPINKALANKINSSKSPSSKKAITAPPKKSIVKKKALVNLTITHPEKIYWPDEKITKGNVVEYYNSIYKHIIPYLRNRPQSLRRTPNGIKDEGFFQKDMKDTAPDWATTVPLYSESVDKNISYLLCNDKDTLLYMVNLGCIEINPWNSTIENIDAPDYIVMDIDPGPKNTFDQVIEVVLALKKILDQCEVDCYCKTSGSSGLHVYIPMGGKYDYQLCRDFAELIARVTVEALPKLTTIERSLSKRKNRIYIDYLQNKKGQTLASVYSIRPRPGATVSAPLLWEEVKKGLHPSQFTIKNMPARINTKGDLFKGVLGKGVNVKKSIQLLEKLFDQ